MAAETHRFSHETLQVVHRPRYRNVLTCPMKMHCVDENGLNRGNCECILIIIIIIIIIINVNLYSTLSF